MSRKVSDRYVLDAVLQAETPLHIGAATAGFDTDMELVRDGMGRLVIPGTALAGSLRSALRRFDPGRADDPWWGDADQGGAARIMVEDAPRIDGADDDVAVRDAVALHHRHATARDHHLFSREIIQPGARFRLRISIDADEDESDRGKDLLDAITGLLTKHGIDVGAGSSRGLGRVRISPVAAGANDPASRRWVERRDTAAGMIQLLRGRTSATPVTAPAVAEPDPGTLLITIAWQPTGTVMSTRAIASSAVDTLPAVGVDPADPTKLRLLLAGTGLAGAFSARVERIARTLAASSTSRPADIDDCRRNELPGLRELFGSPGRGRDDRGVVSAATFADCLGSAQIDRAQWDRRAEGDHSEIPNQVAAGLDDKQKELVLTAKALDKSGLMTATHNAIDRWTGGASDGLLYTVAEPKRGTTWDDLQLRVDIGLLESGEHGAAGWALLLLGLKALADGTIPLGGLVTRGLGSISVTKVEFKAAADAGSGTAEDLGKVKTLNAALKNPAITEPLNRAIADAYPTAGAAA